MRSKTSNRLPLLTLGCVAVAGAALLLWSQSDLEVEAPPQGGMTPSPSPPPPEVPGSEESGPPSPLAAIPFPPAAAAPAERILASGFVQDGAGRVLPDVRVRIRRRAGLRYSTAEITTTDADGRFAFRGPAPEDIRLELRPVLDGHYCEATEVTTGTRDVVLVVRRHGGFTGNLAPRDPALLPELGLRVESQDLKEDDAPRWRYAEPDRQGRFSVLELAPGRWRVDLVVAGERFETLSDVEVPDGAVVRPPALQDRAIGEGWFAPRVTVLDAAGKPLSGAMVEFRPRDGSPARMVKSDGAGLARAWFKVAPELELRVGHFAYATACVVNPAWPAEVLLDLRASLTLRFSGGLPRVDGVESYELVLESPEASPVPSLPQMRPTPQVPGAVSAKFESLDPGRWILRLRPSCQTASGRALVGRTLELATLDLGPGAHDREIAVDPEAVRRAMTP